MHPQGLDWQKNNGQNGGNFRIVNGRKIYTDAIISTQIIKDYFGEWIIEAEYNRLSKQTIASKINALEKFIWWLDHTDRSQVTRRDIKAFVAYLHSSHTLPEGRWETHRRKPLSARATEIYFVNIRAFFNWMVREAIIENNPANDVSVPKSRKPEIKPFTQKQALALLEAAKRTNNPYRDTAIMSLLFDTGIRVSELCNLRLEDVTMRTTSHGTITIRHGKGDKQRTVPFDRVAARALRRYLRHAHIMPEKRLFSSNGGNKGRYRPLTRSGIQQLFSRLETLSGITGVRCSPHTCRHTFAIEALRRGVSLPALQLMLGHEKLEMVLVYAKLAQSDIEKAHRLGSPLNGIMEKQ